MRTAGHMEQRKNGTQGETALQGGEEIARNPFNFKDWECDRAAQKWLEFQPVLGVREYWAVVQGTVGAAVF